MASFLIAAGWVDFVRLLPIVIAFLVWLISRAAAQVPQKPPQRGRVPPQPLAPPPKKVPDNLQSEINEFLRQAQAAREGRTAVNPNQPSVGQSRDVVRPSSGRPGEGRPKRASRRPTTATTNVGTRSQEKRPESRPPSTPVRPEALSAETQAQPRESVAQHVAETLDSSKFLRRATQLSQMQAATDADFRQHMQRVFQHDVGSLPADTSTPVSIGAKGGARATVAPVTAAAAVAPMAKYSSDHRVAADIAALLARGKGIRDAVILAEILKRPDDRW